MWIIVCTVCGFIIEITSLAFFVFFVISESVFLYGWIIGTIVMLIPVIIFGIGHLITYKKDRREV